MCASPPASRRCERCLACGRVLVSDLHLGTRAGADLAAPAAFRGAAGARGSRVPTRSCCWATSSSCATGPSPRCSSVARPFFDELGEAVGDGRIVVVPGNHDHQLLAPWLERRRIAARPLGLEQTCESERRRRWVRWPPDGHSRGRARLSRGLGAAGRLRDARPLPRRAPHRPDASSASASGRVERVLGGLPSEEPAPPDDYERRRRRSTRSSTARPGRRSHARARRARTRRLACGRALHGRDGKRADEARPAAGRVAVPGAVRLAQRFGLGPLSPDLSRGGDQPRRRPRDGRGRAPARDRGRPRDLRPHPSPRAARRRARLAAGDGTRLINTGSWVYAPGILGTTRATASSGPARPWSSRTTARPSFASCSPTTVTPSSGAGVDRSGADRHSPRGRAAQRPLPARARDRRRRHGGRRSAATSDWNARSRSSFCPTTSRRIPTTCAGSIARRGQRRASAIPTSSRSTTTSPRGARR